MSNGAIMVEGVCALLGSALGALKEARRKYPDKGECAIRAVIDVEIQNIGASHRHLKAALGAISVSGARESKGEHE